MDKVVCYVDSINQMDFQKDVILTPYYLTKFLECKGDFYYGVNSGTVALPKEFRNLTLYDLHTKNSSFKLFLKLFMIIVRNHRNIKCLFTFHLTYISMILTVVLKCLNKKSKVWIAADLNQNNAEQLVSHEFVFSSGILGLLKRKFIDMVFHKVDIYSTETMQYYRMFEPLFLKKGWKSLAYFPCSWDEDGIPIGAKEKENIIITCGRLGTYQKNTEMLLKALINVDLKDWKVYLIGPMTDDFSLANENKTFKEYVGSYFKKYPHLKDKVIFTGPIFDTQVLFEYFRKAKIFVLTSRYEGFGNVLAHARWNSNYIISTDVGGACDMTDNWKYGSKVEQDDAMGLAFLLQGTISNSLYNSLSGDFSKKISYNVTLTQLLYQSSFK